MTKRDGTARKGVGAVGRPGFGPTGVGQDWSGSWKAWVAKDPIKPVNMTGCRPPPHCFNASEDKPTTTTILGGKNAPFRLTATYTTFDARGGPSDRTKTHADIFANATSNVHQDPLAAYHPPPDTKLPEKKPEQEPDRWVPMNHAKITTLYNPLSHQRVDISTTKPLGLPRAKQDVEVTIKRGDDKKAPGNAISSAQVLQHDKNAFHRRKGVTEFMDITHPFKANFSDNFHQRINEDPKVFYRLQGPMVSWMEAAIVGKSKIPFRKTQPPGV